VQAQTEPLEVAQVSPIQRLISLYRYLLNSLTPHPRQIHEEADIYECPVNDGAVLLDMTRISGGLTPNPAQF